MGRHSVERSRREAPRPVSRHMLPAALALAMLSLGGGIIAFARGNDVPHPAATPSPTVAAPAPGATPGVPPGGTATNQPDASDVPVTPAGGSATPVGGPGCAGGPAVRVTTTPEMAPTLTKIAESLTQRGGPGCVRYLVDSLPAGVTVNQIAEGSQQQPQIWVPDSPMWLSIVNARKGSSLSYGDVVATSPVGFAVPKSLVDDGARTGRQSWADILKAGNKIGMSDPDSSTASMLALVSAHRAATDSAVKAATQEGIIAASRNVHPDDEFMRLATSGDPSAVMFPASEQQMLAQRADSGDSVDAMSIGDGVPAFEYGVVASQGTDAPPPEAVTALRQALTSDAGKADLRSAGFRVAGEEASAGDVLLDAPGTTDSSVDPTSKEADYTVRAWSALRKSMRMIVGIDVSGSMLKPASPDMNRIELATEASQRALKILPDDTRMGIWLFSYERGPKGEPWFQAAPIRPLGQKVGAGTQRSLLVNVTSSMPQMPQGGTALFDTISNAVKAVQQGYDPTRVNAVVFWTDGINEDAPTMPKQQLLDELKAEAAGPTPVRVILVGVGRKSDMGTLQEIAGASGGVAYDATDPDNIDEVVLDAFTPRPDAKTQQ